MISKRSVIIGVLFCISFQSFALFRGFPVDTSFIEKYSDCLTLRAHLYSKPNSISIVDVINDKILVYKPNDIVRIGPGFSYKWFGIDFGFAPGFMNNDEDLYGTTEQFDLQSNFYYRSFKADINVQYYKGYYIENPSDFDDQWKEGMVYPQRPDMFALALGMGVYYSTNTSRCSLKASFSQSERQKKSAGTWIVGAFYSLFASAADSMMVPSAYKSQLDTSARFLGIISSSVGFSGGYLHTFIFKTNYFCTLSVFPGLGIQSYKSAVEGDTAIYYDRSKMVGRFSTRLSFGYNKPEYYLGLSLVFDNFDFNNSRESYIKYNYGIVRFYGGYRINWSQKRQKKCQS